MTKEIFKKDLKRFMRQLSERQLSVEKGLRKDQHYQNKRKEFMAFIDEALKESWFEMPKKGTRIYSIYYDEWL